MPGRLAAACKIVGAIKTSVYTADSVLMRSFLDACNVDRKFFKDFFKNALPLNDYLPKNKELGWLDPMTEGLDIFNTLKSKLAEATELALMQPNSSYITGANAHLYMHRELSSFNIKTTRI